jgi:hypothetical protein
MRDSDGMKAKPREERRADAAEKLEKKLDRLFSSTEKIPSFSGKAAFMDRIKAAKAEAHSLAWDLRQDAEEAKG